MNGAPMHGLGELSMGSLENPLVIGCILIFIVYLILCLTLSSVVNDILNKGVDYVLREKDGKPWALLRQNCSESKIGRKESRWESRKKANRYLKVDLNRKRPYLP